MTASTFVLTEAGWRQNRREAFFRYQIVTDERTYKLEETITFPSVIPECYEVDQLLRALHIALGVSYYKAFIPPTIEHPYDMHLTEAEFWNTVWKHGLGEFLYKNRLSSEQLATFHPQDGKSNSSSKLEDWKNLALLGIGGGKDSIVAGELLKKASIDVSGFVLASGEALGQSQTVATAMDIDLQVVNRVIDPQILEVNKLEGAYNGHIPISLIFGLIGAMLAVHELARYVVVANEASSSIPQAKWEGVEINHQWSKSIGFERLFQDYLRAYVSPELHYFSAIRPLTSVGVAQIFRKYPHYFEVFTSDNSLFKITPEKREHPRWSRESSKSLSSYVLLSAWLDEATLVRIFGRNFFNEAKLQNMFANLLGAGDNVILDCVGTPDELRASLAQADARGVGTGSVLMEYARNNKLIGSVPIEPLFELGEHAYPKNLEEKLISTIKEIRA